MKPETKANIEKEAENKFPYYRDKLGDINPADEFNTEQYMQSAAYIAGATAWAERVEELEREKSEGIAAFLAKLPPDSKDAEISALKEKLAKVKKVALEIVAESGTSIADSPHVYGEKTGRTKCANRIIFMIDAQL